MRRWLEIALKDGDDAADAAQQVFERALRALPRYVERGGFTSWVFSIARNLAYDRLKAAEHTTASMDPSALSQAQDAIAIRLQTADAQFAGRGGVAAMIAHLPQLQRRVLTLAFVFEYSAGEIAEALGTTPDAVRHAKQRALRSLARTEPTRADG